MTKLSLVAARLDQAGPFLLGALVFGGVFARGWANIAYGILILWGLVWWIVAVMDRRSLQPNWLPLPPTRWAVSLGVFVLTWLLAVLAGGNPVAGLGTLALLLYPLILPLLVWPIFSRWPGWPIRLRFLWGLGLIVVAFLTFREGGYQLGCLRAKAYLGVIDLGSVLGQLIPVTVAALLMALSLGRRRETAFFGLALVAASLALTQNCSRQTLLTVPALNLLILWVYRHHFTDNPRRRFLVLAFILALLTLLPLAVGGGQRFLETLECERTSDTLNASDIYQITHGAGSEPAPAPSASNVPQVKPDPGFCSVALNSSDTLRVNLWRLGWKTFMEHPLLGQGPGSSFQLVEPGKEERTVHHVHNVFIYVLAQTGLMGFFGLLTLHLAPLSLLWHHRRSRDQETFFWVWAAFAVNLQLVLNGLTDQVFGLKAMMYVHWIVTAAALWQTQRPQKEASE